MGSWTKERDRIRKKKTFLRSFVKKMRIISSPIDANRTEMVVTVSALNKDRAHKNCPANQPREILSRYSLLGNLGAHGQAGGFRRIKAVTDRIQGL